MAADFAACLARLLTDEFLRCEFARDAARVADSLELREEERTAWMALPPDQVNRQAEVLLTKRFREVSRLIPRTTANLGCEAYSLYRCYATHVWPSGPRRHVLDAVAFCRYLRQRTRDRVCDSEANLAAFSAHRRRLAIRLSRDVLVAGRSRRSVQILFRWQGRIRQWALYMG